MDRHNAVQRLLHNPGSHMLAASAIAASHGGSSAQVGCGRPKCGGRLPVCERQLHLLGMLWPDMQTTLAAQNGALQRPPRLPSVPPGEL